MSRSVNNSLLITYDSDDSSDFEAEITEFDRVVRKTKIFRPRPNYHELYDDDEFVKRFRLRRSTVDKVLDLTVDDIKHPSDRNNAISPLTQLLLTLRFFATGNFLITSADFGGVSVASGGQIVKRVSYALAFKSREFIKLPSTASEIMEQKVKFYELARFPKVIGVIDCTHIKIQSPSREYGEEFRNRKGYFSLNVQALVNSNMEFVNLVARWPGSAHDSNIFAHSRLRPRLENREFPDSIILGDAGYAISQFLLTPLANPTTRGEKLYNESHIRTRNVVERTFGIWKRRFPVLFFGIRLKMETIMAVIQSCAILHNFARVENDPQPPDEIEDVQILENEMVEIETTTQTQNNLAQSVRNALIMEHFARM